jgi:hypothetical protein
MWINMSKCIVVGACVFLSKFDENWSCGVELCMNLCSLVIVIDLEHVVVELVLWVPRLMNWWRDFDVVNYAMSVPFNEVVVLRVWWKWVIHGGLWFLMN